MQNCFTLRSCACPLGLGDVPPFLNIGPPGGGDGVNATPGGDTPTPALLISDLLLPFRSTRVEYPPENALRSTPESSERDGALRALLLPEASTRLAFSFGISGSDSAVLVLSFEPLIAFGTAQEDQKSPGTARVPLFGSTHLLLRQLVI